MRKILLCALIAASTALALAQGSGAVLLEKFNKALNSAKTLSVNYTVQVVGGAPVTYQVDYAKPNLVKIESPTERIFADGANITTFYKKQKTYFKKKQTEAELNKVISKNDLLIWAPFFNEKLTSTFKSVKSLGTKSRKGLTLQTVEFVMPGGRSNVVTYYLDSKDFIARQAEFSVMTGRVKDLVILDAKTLTVGAADPNSKLFAFVAPDGSRELTEAELNSGKWYTDLEEALKVAKETNKVVLAYFGAEW